MRNHTRTNMKNFLLYFLLSYYYNQINRNIRRQHYCYCDKGGNNAFFFSKIKTTKEQFYSQILELRIPFVSRFENIRFKHYPSKPK